MDQTMIDAATTSTPTVRIATTLQNKVNHKEADVTEIAKTEYLGLFSRTGELQVQVKFKDHSGTVASLRMNPEDILKLISPIDGQFFSEMSFDDWPFEIYKYEIDPIKKILTIRTREAKGKREARSVRPTQVLNSTLLL